MTYTFEFLILSFHHHLYQYMIRYYIGFVIELTLIVIIVDSTGYLSICELQLSLTAYLNRQIKISYLTVI